MRAFRSGDGRARQEHPSRLAPGKAPGLGCATAPDSVAAVAWNCAQVHRTGRAQGQRLPRRFRKRNDGHQIILNSRFLKAEVSGRVQESGMPSEVVPGKGEGPIPGEIRGMPSGRRLYGESAKPYLLAKSHLLATGHNGRGTTWKESYCRNRLPAAISCGLRTAPDSPGGVSSSSGATNCPRVSP